MRKLIAIIFMFIISSNAYYGMVNDKGEKVTNIQDVLREQNLISSEMVEEETNEIAEKEKTEEKQEIIQEKETKVEETPVETKVEVKQQKVSTQESKPKVVETQKTTEAKKETKQETKQEVQIQEKNKQETKTEVKVQEPETPKCSDTKHGVGAGNTGKWFNSYNEAVAYYDNLINGYSNQIHNGEITIEEYNKKCPYGYEVWSCPYCNKWTLNFYFR